VTVDIVVNAGSFYETVFTNGLSHFLEHLLFDGTETQTREEISNRFDSKGVYYNAFTRKDFVTFLITTPTEFLEDAVRNQADMLLHSILPPKEFEKEKEVVLEEMTKDRDRPENILDEFFDSHAFAGTPYERPVIGYPNTIKAVTREEVFDFYKNLYVPNNMTAIVIGNFDTEEVIELFEEVYGSMLPKPIPKVEIPKGFFPEGRRIYKKEFNTERIYLKIGFRAPLVNDREAPAFSILADLLNLEGSPLKEALMGGEKPLVHNVRASYEFQKGLGVFTISATFDPTVKPKRVIDGIVSVLEKIRDGGVDEKLLEHAKKGRKSEEVYNRGLQYRKLHLFRDVSLLLGPSRGS
jgi:predicted Zn-dependent peptidase